MPHARRSNAPFGRWSRSKANLATIAVVMVILALGIVLLVKSINYTDESPRSSVN